MSIIQKLRKKALSYWSPPWLPSHQYAEQFGAKWHQVYERTANRRSPPVQYGCANADLQSKLDPEFPEAGVLEIRGASLHGRNGWLTSKEGFLLPDHSWYGRHLNEIGGWSSALLPRKSISGTGLSLASDFAENNYGHFLLDCIGRLGLFYMAGFKLADVDYIFCPRPPSKTAKRLFDELGIPKSKCIWTNENKYFILQTDRLYVPSFPGTRRNYPKWLPLFLQEKFLATPPVPSRRLYISRSGCKRTIINESAIRGIMNKYHFELYDPARSDNQPYDFSESTIVVGPHGAGLADIAFCQPGTRVLELIPSDHMYPYFYTLADAAGLDYGYLIGKSTHQRPPSSRGPSNFDFYVDEAELVDALDKIIRHTEC